MADTSLGPGSEEALLAWAGACLSHEEVETLDIDSLADGRVLVRLAQLFARPAEEEGLEDDDQDLPSERDCSDSASRQRLLWAARRLARSRPPQPPLVDEEGVVGGGRVALRTLLAIALLVSVEGHQQQVAVGSIMQLHPSHQAALAGILQKLMVHSALAPLGGSRPPSRPPSNDGTGTSSGGLGLSRRVSVDPAPDRTIGELKAEVDELHVEYQMYCSEHSAAEDMKQSIAASLKQTKDSLFQEADLCQDLLKDIEERTTEHHQLMRSLDSLRQALHDEMRASATDREHVVLLEDRVESKTQKARALTQRVNEMEERLDRIESRSAESKESKRDWKGRALNARLGRTQEAMTALKKNRAKRDEVKAHQTQHKEHIYVELREAEARLIAESEVWQDTCRRLDEAEGEAHSAEAELESVSGELRAITHSNLDRLRFEIVDRQTKIEEARAGEEDLLLRSRMVSKRIGELEALTADGLAAFRRAASERTGAASREESEAAARLAAERREAQAVADDRACFEDEREEAALSEAVAVAEAAAGSEVEAALAEEAVAEASISEAEEAAAEAAEAVARLRAGRRAARAELREERLAQPRALRCEAERQAEAEVAERGAEEILALSAELESSREEAKGLRAEIASARHRQRSAEEEREAAESATARERALVEARRREAEEASELRIRDTQARHARQESRAALTPGEEEARAQDRSEASVEVAVLEFQLLLREREQAHRESLAGEAEAMHQRELRYLAMALHRLGQRYGRSAPPLRPEETDKEDPQPDTSESR